ncbi:MAG: glycosyltransferase family 2 protein, partial [Paracoccus sp. (in: a-proteobacteria)]
MAISFVVTTYNIAPYLGRCLDSVAQVALGGDQIVLVDDGSTDDSVEILSQFAQHPPQGVEVTLILLGTNTIGGVGIGGNIGLTAATRDTVFFVDGDDWINAEGFRRARAQWVLQTYDIMLTNYLEFDEAAGKDKSPADQYRWSGLRHSDDIATQRQQAL